MDMADLIAEKERTHGHFPSTAALAVRAAQLTTPIGEYFCAHNREEPFPVRHGREMICVKLARIASGDPLTPEHWDDIAGYAKLVADWLREQQNG